MNRGKKKTKTQEPFKDCAKALVRQDPRTQVKTTTAQTETTNTSTQNSTLFNKNKNTVTYQSTKQPTTLRQTARITEITPRRTPTLEVVRYVHLKTGVVTLRPLTDSVNFSSVITDSDETASSATDSDDGSLTPKTPTLVKTQTTTLSEKSDWKSPRSLNRFATNPNKIITTWTSRRSTPPPITSSSNSISSTSTRTPASLRSRSPPLTSGTSTLAGSTTTRTTASLRNKDPPLTTKTINSSGSTKLSTIVASGKTLTTAIAKPGQAYIFNHVIFDNPNTGERIGSSEDVKSLVSTFEYFKMKVNVIENATVGEIKKTVDKIKTKDFSKNACLVIVIMSHGRRREKIAAKDVHYYIDDDVLFPILSNRSLIDKPKLLFIQACKGSQTIYTDSVSSPPSPNEVLKCYSTFEGFVSYRTEKGSFFIQALCKTLKEFGANTNIKDIMDLVTKIVKEESEDTQIPAYISTLTKQFIFGDYVK